MKKEKEMHEAEKKPKNSYHYVLYILMIATIAIMVMNQIAVTNLGNSAKQVQLTALTTAKSNAPGTDNSNTQVSTNTPDVIPKGVPLIYGSELGVSYDDVSATNQQKSDATIKKLALQDVNIKLSGAQLQRYINITGQISCEYCCGAPSIIFTTDTGQYKAGDAACGCAHSYAMRGVAKYLITKHGSEFTDDQILEELGKWKTLFFPGPIAQKASILQQKGIDLNYINLASNKYRDIEKDSSSSSGTGMVGGC